MLMQTHQHASPIEIRAGILFTSRRDLIVTDNGIDTQLSVAIKQSSQYINQGIVLCQGEGFRHAPLQLYTYGVAIASGAAAPTGVACMPRALVKRDELKNHAVSIDKHMRRHFQVMQLGEVRVDGTIKRAGKEGLGVTRTVPTLRERDAVNDNEFGVCPRRACVTMRARMPRSFLQTVLSVNVHVPKASLFSHLTSHTTIVDSYPAQHHR